MQLRHCTYCGRIADTIDHVPPRCYCARMDAPCETVDACRQCNSVLNGLTLLTIAERREYVKTWLWNHFSHVLRGPDWTQRELDELGPSLRAAVEAELKFRSELRARLSWKGPFLGPQRPQVA